MCLNCDCLSVFLVCPFRISCQSSKSFSLESHSTHISCLFLSPPPSLDRSLYAERVLPPLLPSPCVCKTCPNPSVNRFTSWINIVGRVFASNQSGDFSCHTYPVYKPIDTKEFKGANAPLTFVPTHDPKYARLPWAKTGVMGWGIVLSIGPLLGSAVIALVYSIALQSFRKKPTESNQADGASLATPYLPSDFPAPGLQTSRPLQPMTMGQPAPPMTFVGNG
jgi:hypothetical protein